MRGLSLKLHVFALFPVRTLVFESFLDPRDIKPFSDLEVPAASLVFSL